MQFDTNVDHKNISVSVNAKYARIETQMHLVYRYYRNGFITNAINLYLNQQ